MLVTFGVRYPVLALVGKAELPQPVFRALRYVPPAVLTAIIIPEIFLPDGKLALQWSNAPLIASIIAGLIAWRTKNLLATIVFGMASFWVWKFLLGN